VLEFQVARAATGGRFSEKKNMVVLPSASVAYIITTQRVIKHQETTSRAGKKMHLLKYLW
jgi:hypothetical protein